MAQSVYRMSKRRVEGLVLIGSAFQNDDVMYAIRQYLFDIPVVMMNGALNLDNVYSVLADEHNGAFECVRYLINKGRKHIAFILHATTAANLAKLEGYKHAISSLLPGTHPTVYETHTNITEAYVVTQKLMTEHPETDGILYGVDLLAASGIRALSDMRIMRSSKSICYWHQQFCIR